MLSGREAAPVGMGQERVPRGGCWLSWVLEEAVSSPSQERAKCRQEGQSLAA